MDHINKQRDKSLVKTLFGDTWNIVGVTFIVAVALVLAGLGHPSWAVFAMPAAALGVIAVLAGHRGTSA